MERKNSAFAAHENQSSALTDTHTYKKLCVCMCKSSWSQLNGFAVNNKNVKYGGHLTWSEKEKRERNEMTRSGGGAASVAASTRAKMTSVIKSDIHNIFELSWLSWWSYDVKLKCPQWSAQLASAPSGSYVSEGKCWTVVFCFFTAAYVCCLLLCFCCCCHLCLSALLTSVL